MLKMIGYHRNINSLTGWGHTSKYSFILLEMCYGGTLEDLVTSTQTGLTENQAAAYIMTLLETTKYIHGKGWSLCVQQASGRHFSTSSNAGVLTS